MDMQEMSKDDLLEGIQEEYREKEYADLTVVHGNTEYRVHKLVVCTRSKWFAAICAVLKGDPAAEYYNKPGMMEDRINLSHEDPVAVQMLIEWMYHSDYPAPKDVNDSGIDDESDGAPELPMVDVHARVYILAEKYKVEALRVVAYEKFLESVEEGGWRQAEFLEAVREIFEANMQDNLGIKDAVVNVFRAHQKLRRGDAGQEVIMDIPELAMALILSFDDAT